MQLEFFEQNAPWFWNLFGHHILPNLGVLVLSVLLFVGIGFVIWVVLLILGGRGKWFKRHKKWYSFLAKLAYVWWLIVLTAGGGVIGGMRGLWKIVERETPVVSEELYKASTAQVFKTEEEKLAFIEGLRTTAKVAMSTTDGFTHTMVGELKHKSTGYGLVDSIKNGGTDLVMEQFGDEVSKGILFGVMKAGGKHVGVDENISYGEFSSALDAALHEDAHALEADILESINQRLLKFLKGYYNGYLGTVVLIVLALFSLPLVELLIFRMWLRRKRDAGIDPFAPPAPPESEKQYEF
jgi:hypothetical protein